MGFGCSGGTPTTTVVDPDPIRTRFVAANGRNPYGSTWDERRLLTIREADNLVFAVRAASGDNPYLQDAVLTDFTNTPITKWDTDFPMVTIINPDRTRVSFRLNLGDPGIVYQSQSAPIRGPIDPHGGLGTMLFHERLHWEGVGQGGSAEGAPYGMEYYFTRRSGAGRATDILNVGEWGDALWTDLPVAQHRFCVWAFVMKWCYDIADGTMPVASMNRTRALQCATDFVTDGLPLIEWGTDRGQALAWARTQVNARFGAWNEGDLLPGTTTPPADTPAYRTECRTRISTVMSASMP